MEPAPERIGRYRILERVGAGGMGVLYRAIDTILDRDVAIKVMLTDMVGEDDEMRARFSREARSIAKLQHRNIVTVFELGEENGTQYIVMEFLRGTSLAARMHASPPLTLDEKIDIVAQLCAGLAFAHGRGIVHRDVKPANTFILTDGTVKLLDFGIAKVSDSNLTRMGATLGSVHYMSPEQIGGENIDARADVFSTGALLYELLAGKKPFDDPVPTMVLMKILNEEPVPLKALAPDVPDALVAIVNRAMAKDPARRFSSAGEIERELINLRRGLSQRDAIAGDAFMPSMLPNAAGQSRVSDAVTTAPTVFDGPTIAAPPMAPPPRTAPTMAAPTTSGPTMAGPTMAVPTSAGAPVENPTIRLEPPAPPPLSPASVAALPLPPPPTAARPVPPASTATRSPRRATWRIAVPLIVLLGAGAAFATAAWLRRLPATGPAAQPAVATPAATKPEATTPRSTPPAALPDPGNVPPTSTSPVVSAPPKPAPPAPVVAPDPNPGSSAGTTASASPEPRRQPPATNEQPVATSAKPETASASPESASPKPAIAPSRPVNTPPRPQVSARCDSLLERQSLGETLSPGDAEFMQKNCKD